jgi:hypothetical protein
MYARNEPYDDIKKSHSVDTLAICIRCILEKNLTGWEVMEIFAGGVNQSDNVFMEFTSTVDDIIGDADAPGKTHPLIHFNLCRCYPASLRHQVLQLAITFVCGIGQLRSVHSKATLHFRELVCQQSRRLLSPK